MKAALSVAALTLAGSALAELKEVWYNITYIEDVNLTGDFSRRVIGINGTYPPPPVSLNQGDTYKVHAYNGLGDTPTTIHHHGMYFPNASWSDGADMISQCPIPPGETFTYEVTTENQPPGTYWWHSHYNGQLVDGFRAPLIIHADEEPHQYDEEYTVILADWYEREFPDLMVEFLNIYNPTGAEPVPQTALIKFAANDTWVDGWNNEASMHFEPGKTYRIRIINMASLSMFHVWMDGHDMRVIEADGISTEEFATDYLSLGVAQRYSVLVDARNDTDSNYYFHADFNPDMFDVIPDTLSLNYTANIVYDDNADFAESTLLPEYKAFDDTRLTPIEAMELEPADVVYNMSITFETRTDGTNRGVFNDVPFNDAKSPLSLVALNMGDDATNPEVYGNPTNNIVLPYNKTVEVTLWNTDSGAHPFHLHGHHVQLASRVGNYSDPSIDTTIDESQKNPMRRDTVQVEGGGYVTYRFKSWNPGTWIMHCHISWHLASGLALTMIEAPLEMQAWQPDVPDFYKDQCQAGGFAVEGNAAGHSGTNLKGLHTGPWPQWPTYGWTPKAIGALAGCIITAILGVITVCWYSFGGEISEADMLAEVKAAAEAKAAKASSRGGGLTSIFKRRNASS